MQHDEALAQLEDRAHIVADEYDGFSIYHAHDEYNLEIVSCRRGCTPAKGSSKMMTDGSSISSRPNSSSLRCPPLNARLSSLVKMVNGKQRQDLMRP